jgi:hypothetical protein
MPQYLAHQIQIDRTVGAIQHLEPNDTPRSGEPTLVWFALTRQGGIPIPLADCDCRLSLYPASQQPEPAAIATPPLSPYSPPGHRDIPSAQVTFPQVGLYRLVLAGEPKAGVEQAQLFEPFSLSFEVTVAQGRSIAPTPLAVTPGVAPSQGSPTPGVIISEPPGVPSPGNLDPLSPVVLGVGIGAIVVLGLAWGLGHRDRP